MALVMPPWWHPLACSRWGWIRLRDINIRSTRISFINISPWRWRWVCRTFWFLTDESKLSVFPKCDKKTRYNTWIIGCSSTSLRVLVSSIPDHNCPNDNSEWGTPGDPTVPKSTSKLQINKELNIPLKDCKDDSSTSTATDGPKADTEITNPSG